MKEEEKEEEEEEEEEDKLIKMDDFELSWSIHHMSRLVSNEIVSPLLLCRFRYCRERMLRGAKTVFLHFVLVRMLRVRFSAAAPRPQDWDFRYVCSLCVFAMRVCYACSACSLCVFAQLSLAGLAGLAGLAVDSHYA